MLGQRQALRTLMNSYCESPKALPGNLGQLQARRTLDPRGRESLWSLPVSLDQLQAFQTPVSSTVSPWRRCPRAQASRGPCGH